VIPSLLLFAVLAVAGGFGSSWYMVEKGSFLTTRAYGPWVVWTAAGRADADPYTRAHFARRGTLPVSTSIALTYEAIIDSDKQRLHSACDYAIEGEEPSAAWWSLTVYDEQGRLIENAAERYSYNSATLMRAPGGRFSITLARNARPGNWLPTGDAGRLTLVLSIEEAQVSGPGQEEAGGERLPRIRRLACR
jgi:hypothetical protein